jgi:hypothetical protein
MYSNASCGPRPKTLKPVVTDLKLIENVFNSYDRVFLGKAHFDDKDAGPGRFGKMHFQVLETFKGNTLEIETVRQGNPNKCGFRAYLGNEYLIVTHTSGHNSIYTMTRLEKIYGSKNKVLEELRSFSKVYYIHNIKSLLTSLCTGLNFSAAFCGGFALYHKTPH